MAQVMEAHAPPSGLCARFVDLFDHIARVRRCGAPRWTRISYLRGNSPRRVESRVGGRAQGSLLSSASA